MSKRGNTITEQNVDYALSLSYDNKESAIVDLDDNIICRKTVMVNKRLWVQKAFNANMEKGLIEVKAPLAYMRGRTLDNAFIILDEAQNTTPAQMKMFLTRIGFGSKGCCYR